MFDSGFPRYMRLIFEHRSEYYSEINEIKGAQINSCGPKIHPQQMAIFFNKSLGRSKGRGYIAREC